MGRKAGLEYARITVSGGDATIEYKWADLGVPGSDSLDEDCSDWSDDDILGALSDLAGLSDEDVAKVEFDRV